MRFSRSSSRRPLSSLTLSLATTRSNRTPTPTTQLQTSRPTLHSQSPSSLSPHPSPRLYSSLTPADEILEEIQEQYATARDEFEIASEETEKHSVYAADDRAAAREELNKLKEMFEEALEGPDGEEVKSRVGQRIRELENAVVNLEKSATED
jgi:hypothetical protein